MSDHEDRTQAPSRRRIDQARERGQVAQSPELTAAAGLLAAALVLAARGDALASALVALFRGPFQGAGPDLVTADAAAVVARLRFTTLSLARPLFEVLGGFLAGALAAHQAQVRGLWAPGLLAPDPSRLWAFGHGPDPAARAGRGLWALARALIVAAVAVWVVRSHWPRLQHLGRLDAPGLALASGQAIRRLTLTLAGATLALGLLDLGLQHQRFQTLMRLTPEEHREDLRSAEGDPMLRARRRRVAQSMRGRDLDGASLALTGPSGLTVVLAGGPPPMPVSVRAMADGPTGARLRRDAASARLPTADAPDLARRLARRRPPNLPLSPDLLGELTLVWPSPNLHTFKGHDLNKRQGVKPPVSGQSAHPPLPPDSLIC